MISFLKTIYQISVLFLFFVSLYDILASILATILAAILETIECKKVKVVEKDSSYPRIYFLIPRTHLHLLHELRYEVKGVWAAILAAILETVECTKLKVAEHDSSYPKMYFLIPRTQLHLVCEPRYDVKRVLAAILAAILNFDRKPLFIKRLPG